MRNKAEKKKKKEEKLKKRRRRRKRVIRVCKGRQIWPLLRPWAVEGREYAAAAAGTTKSVIGYLTQKVATAEVKEIEQESRI